MYPGKYAATHPQRPAIIMDTGEALSFAELDARANRLSHLFRKLGLQPGDHIAFCVENRPEFVELCWGAHYAGLLYTACSTRLTAPELAYIVDDCGASILVLSAQYADKAPQLDNETPGVIHRYSLGGPIDGYEPFESAAAAMPDTPCDEVRIEGADMLYSSGTTGRPKGIKPHGQQEVLGERTPIFALLLGQMMGFEDGDVYLSPAPAYHTAPLHSIMGAHALGGTVILMRRFDPEQMLHLIAEHRVTHTQVVPTMFNRLLRLDPDVRRHADIRSLKGVVHAAAPCPVETKRAMLEWLGPIIYEFYGSTERAGVTWSTSEDWRSKPGTVGRAVIGTVHIIGDDGREVPAGETGDVYFDGNSFEYHNDPEKTRDVHNERGWSCVGDIGHLDEDGYLFLTDRRSHMIITGGVNVYPQEAENALIEHEAVVDAAVFGIPHEDFGEEVKAVVQPVELPGDDDAAAVLERELIDYCRSRLADYKCPRSIDFRAELPRHETGKLYKRLLVDEYRQKPVA